MFSAHVTSDHHLIKKPLITELWKQIIKYADTEINEGISLDLNVVNC